MSARLSIVVVLALLIVGAALGSIVTSRGSVAAPPEASANPAPCAPGFNYNPKSGYVFELKSPPGPGGAPHPPSPPVDTPKEAYICETSLIKCPARAGMTSSTEVGAAEIVGLSAVSLRYVCVYRAPPPSDTGAKPINPRNRP